MEVVKRLDPRLAALLPVIDELRAIRAYFAQVKPPAPAGEPTVQLIAEDRARQPPYWRALHWIDDTIERSTLHLHARSWPPVWWRLGKMDFDLIFRNIRRADADGWFFGEPGSGNDYIPERDHILAWVDRIEAMYEQARKS